jgi:hypothetical protein
MSDGTSYGERLLRSPEAARAAAAIEVDVQLQLEAALHGPLAVALAAPAGPPSAGVASGGANNTAAAGQLLNAEIPRRFIAAGACFSVAYAALAAGDEIRVAGALLCARRWLFQDDAAGAAAVQQAVRNALQRFGPEEPDAGSSIGASGSGKPAQEAMQRTVAAQVDSLGRAFQASVGHIQTAALGTRSWLAATGGVGPGSVAGQTQFGPFLDGLVRWAFYLEAALEGLRADDWSRVGAALVAAQQYVSAAR